MTAMANVYVSRNVDRNSLKTTDVAAYTTHTFSPDGYVSPGVAQYVDRVTGVPVGFPRMTLSVRPPANGSQVYKVVCKVAVPTLEVTSANTETGYQPAPKKAYENACHMEWLLPARGTELERTHLLHMVISFLVATLSASDSDPTGTTGSPVGTAIIKLEPVF